VTGRDEPSPERPLIVVAVGTDHHPFGRVIDWVDRWLARGGADRVECVMQHGSAPAPRWGEPRAFLEHAEFTDLVARARVVVCHGGPATIAECRRLGRLPLVVPRRPEYGEHVDNHQVLFTARLADKKLVQLASSEDELAALLDDALADRDRFTVDLDSALPVAAAVRRFEELVASLAPTPARP
jgi:UDP-N-acetylglucosamine transferase subunit ALG13